MFWKLLKYEFKNINKWYLAIYGAILVVSVMIGLFLMGIARQVGFTGDISQPITSNSAGLGLTIILFMVFFGLMVALGISTLFLIIRRFKNSVYDRQGYLTLTLPVNQHQIILAKLTGAIIWSLLSLVTLALSFAIIVGLILTTTDRSIDWSLLSPASLEYGNIALTLIYMLITSISSILLIYFCISIGQLFEDHRTAIAILTYFIIEILISIISFHLLPSVSFTIDAVFSIVLNLALSIAYYAGSYYILKNKVNLQ